MVSFSKNNKTLSYNLHTKVVEKIIFLVKKYILGESTRA